MATVISLESRRRKPQEAKDPHVSGKARCLHCRHEWTAVAPVGTYELECPECHLLKGVMVGMCDLAEGTERWVCKCGCDLFLITSEGSFCASCGGFQTWP